MKGRVEGLRAESEEKEDSGDDFAGAALGQPAFDPGENRAGEKQVEEDEKREGQCGPDEEIGVGDGDADADGCGPQQADQRRRRGETVDKKEHEPGAEAHGITQQVAEFGILSGEGGRESGKELPGEEEHPEEDGDGQAASVGGAKVRADAEADGGTDSNRAEDKEGEDARAQLDVAASGAESIEEDAGLDPGERGILAAGERREEAPARSGTGRLYASHESSWTASSGVSDPAPLTMRRNNSSSVSFSSGCGPERLAATPARSSSSEPLATRRP